MKPTELKSKLEQAFPNSHVEVTDLTGTEDHYEVSVQSKAFEGLSRILQHKKVMEVFDPELKSGEVHALSIKTAVPR